MYYRGIKNIHIYEKFISVLTKGSFFKCRCFNLKNHIRINYFKENQSLKRSPN